MRLPAFFSTLKFRIAAIMVATGVLSALGTANLLLDVTQTELTRVLLANDRSDRERTAELLAGKLRTITLSLRAVAQHSGPQAWRDRPSMETYLLSQWALNSTFDVVYALRPDGTMLARLERGAPTNYLPNVADRDYLKRALTTDEVVLSEPLRGRVSNMPLVIVAARMSHDGVPIGVVAGALNLGSTGPFAGVGPPRRAEGAVELVIDRAGTILSHSQGARLLSNAADEPGLSEWVTQWRQAGSPVDPAGIAQLSQGHLVSMAGIPHSDLVHLRVTPQSVAMAPVAAARSQALTAAAACGALAALLSGVLAWFLVRPISRLRERAERLLIADDTTPDLEPWPADAGEVGAMSRAFSELLKQRHMRQTRMSDLVLQLEAVLDNAEVGIALTRDGRFEMVSRRLCQIFRCERPQMIGRSTRMIYASDEAFEALSVRARPSFMASGAFAGELELMRSDGEAFWARLLGRAVVPGDPSRGTIWVVDDVTQAREHREQLAWAASHDALTGLANRPAFETLLEEATARAVEHPFCALFIDLDRFKQVNDSGGHAAGDTMLRDVARVLAARLRKSDTLARIGGDEFAALLLDCPPSQAHTIAEGLRVAVEHYALPWQGQTYRVGTSIGLVSVDGGHATAADVLRAADAACYAAKREGRNRVATVVAD
jgi:diguanylate cyclase